MSGDTLPERHRVFAPRYFTQREFVRIRTNRFENGFHFLEGVPGKERLAACNGYLEHPNFGYHLPTENVGSHITALYDFPGYVPGGVEINYGARRGRFALGHSGGEAGADWKFLRGNHSDGLVRWCWLSYLTSISMDPFN